MAGTTAGTTAGNEDEASVERAAGEQVQRSVLPVPRPPGSAGVRSHAAAVVGSDDEILAAALPFLAAGLEAGDTTVLACPDELAELIRAGLGVPADTLENLPRIGLLDTRAPDALTVTHRLLERARSTGSGRVRLVGQVQFGEQPRSWREGARYEAARNVLLARESLAGLCLYDSRILPEEVVDGARATHPELVVGGVRRSSAEFADPRDFLRRLPVHREPVEASAPVLDLPAATVLADLRHRLGAALTAHVADADLADDLHLAVSEVAANAFRHGVPPVSARMWVGPDQLICEIGDRGSAFADPLAGFQPAHGPDLGRGGMGLWLARKLFDHVDLLPGPDGLVVRLATRVP
ncbi:anti-sigma factor RsbA family regulatory protein [Blastococcus aurantiacus]|uniref:anti-sigma factor RsbA family regulatory protein n=1 Tax=Blastococcus aurantiacus TaxID=1550231 RepID=UPI000B80FE29|nr:anti-sigma factor RsbA family regulatory protein [Blastococcus aurantiacus]